MKRWAACILVLTACSGELAGPSREVVDPVGSGRPSDGDPSTPDVVPDVPMVAQPEFPAPRPQVARLSHDQYVNSVQDAFGVDASAAAQGFRSDSGGGGFLFNNPVDLEVDDALWDGYRRAAGQLARDILANQATMEGLTAGAVDTGEAARAMALIQEAGLRLHRRPLTEDQVQAYLSVYQAGADEGFDSGAELVLSAMLQSPRFIYRVETNGLSEDGVIFLDAWELASRLSFFLWNSGPDAALRAAAADGSLLQTASLEAQTARMLADPRAESIVLSFHEQLLKVVNYDGISPNPTFFPDAPDNLPELAREETRRFLSMLFGEAQGYREFLTSNETFVEQELAALYELEGDFGAEFRRVSLPENRRNGIFTQIGFLAANSSSVNPNIIHRGVFLNNYVVCNTLNPPPADIPPLPPSMGRTNRETVRDHTEQAGTSCQGCHAPFINPLGYAFESFDAIGRWRTEDNGFPVDTTAEPFIGDAMVPVQGALELTEQMASLPTVHACFAEHWVSYAFGQPAADEDQTLIDRLGTASLEGASIRELIVEVVKSRPFRSRDLENG
ncbi:MAG: DUF1592 domain-containing protein [Myxococcota bacterium]